MPLHAVAVCEPEPEQPEETETAGLEDKHSEKVAPDIAELTLEVHVCLARPPERGTRSRRLAALASTFGHAALLAAMMSGSGEPTPSARPKYRLQILHLQPPTPSEAAATKAAGELWTALHPSSVEEKRVSQSPAHPASGPKRQVVADETLIVENSPPDLKISQPIPLPIAMSWTALQPLPPKQDQARLGARETPTAEPMSVPEVNMISLPEPPQRAPDAATIPRVNQSRAPDAQAKAAAPEAARIRAATEGGARSGTEAGAVPDVSVASEQPRLAAPVTTDQAEADAADPKLTRIELPPNGKPRTAILSESPQIPGRVVATVYLRMGLPKSWTLEYWAQSGTAGLDSPWAYSMLRPNLTLPAEADALLVRGRLTVEGRLEQLAMLAPVEWAQKDSLFRALGQWKFRPPARDGQPVSVEVLLVIPRQTGE